MFASVVPCAGKAIEPATLASFGKTLAVQLTSARRKVATNTAVSRFSSLGIVNTRSASSEITSPLSFQFTKVNVLAGIAFRAILSPTCILPEAGVAIEPVPPSATIAEKIISAGSSSTRVRTFSFTRKA